MKGNENKNEYKKIIIIVFLIIIVISGLYIFKQIKYSKRADVKVPVLLYHNFVTTVPESDPENFNYINTPQSFEENIKTLLENGYTIISIKELADCDQGKMKLPSKPIILTFIL